MSTLVLQCPRCLREHVWDRSKDSGPGYCICGAYAPWRVIPKVSTTPGKVILLTIEGRQELHGPHWQPHPDKWVKE